jgi:cation transport protein ChaC
MTRRPRLSAELVRRVHRDLADPGPMQRQRNIPKSWFADTATSLRAALAPGEPLWVFAFGSLIWRAPIAFSERRTGLVRGWHRAFCLGWDTRYRGNVDQPGLMLSLDRGGSCKGVALKIAPERLDADLVRLLERGYAGYVGGLSESEIADRLAVAVGFWGSMAEYLLNTVEHLERLGLHDRHLWRMQELVADRIAAQPQDARAGR